MVIAILAIIAGTLVVAYENLEPAAAKAHAAYNIAAVDSSVRTFRAVNRAYPNNWDSLLFNNGGSFEPLNVLPVKLRGDGTGTAKVGPYVLTQGAVDALSAVGITTVRDVDSSVSNIEFGTYSNALTFKPEQPNRVFDDPNGEGFGATRVLAAGDTVVALNGIAVADFDGVTPSNDGRANKVGNLPSNVAHIVIAFGLGNNTTLIDKTGRGRAVLSEAPNYGNTLPNEYSRLLALFLVAEDSNGDGTIDATEYLSEAEFLGITATDVDHKDEELDTSVL